jgi:ketosteroid isomerase-like protein
MNSRRRTPAAALAACALAATLSSCAQEPGGERQNERDDAQAAAWNRGDIEGYMDGYERAETTTFVSGDAVTRGWQTVLERYRKSYDTREKMGTLAFSELDIKPLSPFYALVTGRWQLTRARDTPGGRFTLLFRRTSSGWRIVHDHTS